MHANDLKESQRRAVVSSSSGPEEYIAPVRRSIIRTRVSQREALSYFEEYKTRPFKRLPFQPIRPEEVSVVRMTLRYEPVLLVEASYEIEYMRSNVYQIHIDDNVIKVIIAGQEYGAEKVPSTSPRLLKLIHLARKEVNAVRIPVKEHVRIVRKFSKVYDHAGKEIKLRLPPDVKPEPLVEELKPSVDMEVLSHAISADQAVRIARASIADRPKDVEDVLKESFRIERLEYLYLPFFYAECVHSPTRRVRILRYDPTAGVITY